MASLLYYCWFISLILSLAYDSKACAVPYDHSFTPECLGQPLKAQYNGGIVVNPELNQGLKGWTISGDANVALGESDDGNKYIVASTTKQSFFKQEFFLDKNKLYTFSAWVQVSHGNVELSASFKSGTGDDETAATVIGRQGCWSMLKGGLVVNASAPYELLFESDNSTADIWVDSISLQPFTQQEWKCQQDQSIDKVRKSRVQFEVADKQGRPISNATVHIRQRRPDFPFGNAINSHILNNTAYRNWFLSRFKYTVLENEMKWYRNERSRGVEDYSISDALVRFAESHGIAMRGHAVLWDSPQMQLRWIAGISSDELRAAANKRLNSVMSRYRGQLIHWDVVNENMHYDFFEKELGPNASAVFYQMASKIDSKALPFLNEFNTIERSVVGQASPPKYMNKIDQIRQQGYNGPLGIGLQAHFAAAPNLPYIRSALDQLASSKLPIWITELDISSGPHQATYLEQVLKEFYSHGGVEGIMMWAAWKPEGCYSMCLTDNNFKNLATGDVVDNFIAELTHELPDSNHVFGASLPHGEYEIKITNTKGDGSSVSRNIDVVPNKGLENDATILKIVL